MPWATRTSLWCVCIESKGSSFTIASTLTHTNPPSHNPSLTHTYVQVQYLGPRGSSTVLHADVVRSHSWSTNVCGRKRWQLIPPPYTHLLYSCLGQQGGGGVVATHLHADVGEMALLYPGLAKARKVAIEVIQEAGETIFVPSDWFHSVENLEPTLSINHNWLNSSNLERCWKYLRSVTIMPLSSQSHSSISDESSHSHHYHDNSQAVDDLLLLWHVISHHSNGLLSKCKHGALDDKEKEQLKQDRQSILKVLADFQTVVDTGALANITFGESSSHVAELLASLECIIP